MLEIKGYIEGAAFEIQLFEKILLCSIAIRITAWLYNCHFCMLFIYDSCNFIIYHNILILGLLGHTKV